MYPGGDPGATVLRADVPACCSATASTASRTQPCCPP